jgi:hypothetical protein
MHVQANRDDFMHSEPTSFTIENIKRKRNNSAIIDNKNKLMTLQNGGF